MTTEQERLNDFEVAQEMLELVMASCTRKIHDEKKCEPVNAAKIAQLEHEFDLLEDEFRGLHFDDAESIARALEKYTPIARAIVEKRKAENERNGIDGA